MTFERGERRGADKLRVTFTGPVEDVAIISGRPPSPGRATAQELAPAGRPVSQGVAGGLPAHETGLCRVGGEFRPRRAFLDQTCPSSDFLV